MHALDIGQANGFAEAFEDLLLRRVLIHDRVVLDDRNTHQSIHYQVGKATFAFQKGDFGLLVGMRQPFVRQCIVDGLLNFPCVVWLS